jgi:hypothetical protein
MGSDPRILNAPALSQSWFLYEHSEAELLIEGARLFADTMLDCTHAWDREGIALRFTEEKEVKDMRL